MTRKYWVSKPPTSHRIYFSWGARCKVGRLRCCSLGSWTGYCLARFKEYISKVWNTAIWNPKLWVADPGSREKLEKNRLLPYTYTQGDVGTFLLGYLTGWCLIRPALELWSWARTPCVQMRNLDMQCRLLAPQNLETILNGVKLSCESETEIVEKKDIL